MSITIDSIETLACDAGWRNYHFLKLTASDGTVGWSEFDEDYGPKGLTQAIEAFAPLLVGADVMANEMIYQRLSTKIRPAPLGLTAEVLGAVENAVIDAKARILGVPVYELLGGKQRDTVPVYWSHCSTWRISHPEHYGSDITALSGVRDAGQEARDRGFTAIKTNLFTYDSGCPRPWRAGFGAPFEPGLNVTTDLVRDTVAHLEALRDGAGDGVELLLDFNFNVRTEGALKLLRAVRDFNLLWVELDLYNPEALALIRQQAGIPIASCETSFGIRQFLPYFQAQAIDVGIVDVVWNGIAQSMKIAHAAEAFDVNVAPHNFYSHMATVMSAHFAMATPNLRIMEHDVDRLDCDDELFTTKPTLHGNQLSVPTGIGWGIEPKEEEIRRRPPADRRASLFIKA